MGIIRFLTIVSLLYAGCSGAAAQENKEKDGNAAANPVGTLSYCLPMTSLSFEVEAVRENFSQGRRPGCGCFFPEADLLRTGIDV